jgi:large subunit ribosomal protein L4
MELEVKNIAGKTLRKITVPSEIFGLEMNEHVLHTVVKAYQANRRQGTHATKTRSFVSGGGKKPFKQKGSGGARQGTTRAPHMPGGAAVHGPQPRDYHQKINRKTKQLALGVALSDRVRDGRLVVVDDFSISTYSTKHVVGILKAFSNGSTLLADERKDDFLSRSARNIEGVRAAIAHELNAENVLRHETLIISENGINALKQRFIGE